MKLKRAFTLIELLVVIAVIGLLATISVISLNNARAKARDAKRAADVKQVQTALELYFNDRGHYPTANEFNSGSIYSTSTSGTTTYMQIIPNAPTPSDGVCTSDQNQFVYNVAADGSSYTISYCLGNAVGSAISGPKCVNPGGISNQDCSTCSSDTVAGFSCVYAGEVYPTVQIGTQVWMAKNLDVGSMVNSGSSTPACLDLVEALNRWTCQINPNVIEKYCYNNDAAYCATYGGLYEWAEVMNFPPECNDHDSTAPCVVGSPHQGICPSGWHIPSDTDWHILEANFSSPPGDSNCSPIRIGYECSPAGTALSINGSSGFNALFPGYRHGSDGEFFDIDNGGRTWTATPSASTTQAFRRILFAGQPDILRGSYYKTRGYAVRCLKD